MRGQTTKSNSIKPIDIIEPSQSQSTTISSSELSSVVPTTSTTTTSNATRPRTGSTKSTNNHNTTATVLPAKSIDMTNETLLLTNESSLSKMELVSESLISNAIIMNSSTNNNYNNNNNHNHSLGVNHIHSKNTKQRTNSNSLVKTIQSSASGGSGGVRISGQKIEMPVLNDFFDHSIYLKNHEHGFR